MKVAFEVGGKKWEGETRWSHYAESGEHALTIFTEDGEPLITPTVALWPPSPMAGEDEVWLKTWAESEDLPEALEKAGVVTLTDEYHATGMAMALRAKLTEESLAEIRAKYEAEPEAAEHRARGRAKRALEPGAVRQ